MPENPVIKAFESSSLTRDIWQAASEAWRAFGGYVGWESPHNPFHAFTIATAEQAEAACSHIAEQCSNQGGSE